jgi:hypothetical protein
MSSKIKRNKNYDKEKEKNEERSEITSSSGMEDLFSY